MQRLLSPIQIGNLTLKNRIVMPAIHHLYTPEGTLTKRFSHYYYARAKGGAGLIIIGGAKFEEFGAAAMMPDVTKATFVNEFRTFTDEMHRLGTKVGIQLYHAGRYAIGNEKMLAPSAVYSSFSRATPVEMTINDIEEAIASWVKAAIKIKEAGFDLVEILASAGYLISQFLSPLTNLRTDEYGGSFENRMRFPKRVIQSVKAAVGNDLVISVRIAGNDFVVGSNTNEDAVVFAKLCQEWGADMINVTGGWHETKIPQLPGEVPHGGFSYLAGAIKESVSIPVMASNRFNLPEFAEEALALEVADLIGFGRPLIADPELPNKIARGEFDSICHCIGCNQGCLARTFFNRPVECSVNPLAGYEYELDLTPTKTPKKILVVGGGPVGSQAAIILKQRGHAVTLWEKQSTLGGQLEVASAPPGKADFKLLGHYQKKMLHDLQVPIVFNQTATKALIEAAQFDEVIVASGSKPLVFPLPKDSSKVAIVTAEDVLLNKVVVGKKVAIIGGGAVGCEVAEYLLEKSALSKESLYFLSIHEAETPQKIQQLLHTSKRDISIIERKKRIGDGFDLGCGWPVMKQLSRLKAHVYTLFSAKEIKDNQLVIENEKKEIKLIPVDTIVLAIGYRSENRLAKELQYMGDKLHVIGDAVQPNKILDGIAQATRLAAFL